MGPSARILLLAACCLLAPRAAPAATSPALVTAEEDVVEIEPNATAQEPPSAVGKSAAAAAVDLIAAEAAAGAAQAVGMPAVNGFTTGEWEVWDVDDDEEEVGKRPLLGAAPAGFKPEGVAPVGVTAEDAAPGGPEAEARPKPVPPPPPVTAPLDALLDFAMNGVNHQVAVNHSTEHPVPDFKKEFKARIGFIKVRGHLDAQGGSVGDLSTLFRDGTATLRKEAGGVLVLDMAAGLRTLRLRYRHYSARAGPVRVSGQIVAEASPAALRAQVALVPPCRAQLRSLSVARVGPLRVRATGLGALRRLLPLLTRWMDKRMRGDVESAVLQRITQIVSAQLQHMAC